jgi:hypothetical protein
MTLWIKIKFWWVLTQMIFNLHQAPKISLNDPGQNYYNLLDYMDGQMIFSGYERDGWFGYLYLRHSDGGGK